MNLRTYLMIKSAAKVMPDVRALRRASRNYMYDVQDLWEPFAKSRVTGPGQGVEIAKDFIQRFSNQLSLPGVSRKEQLKRMWKAMNNRTSVPMYGDDPLASRGSRTYLSLQRLRDALRDRAAVQ